MRTGWRIFWAAALVLLPGFAPHRAAAQDKPVLVFAAASLKNALEDIALSLHRAAQPVPIQQRD